MALRRSIARRCFSTRQSKSTTISQLTGNIDNDGLNPYELDLLETADWTTRLLTCMEKDGKTLEKSIRPFTPPPANALCFQTTRTFSYDFSKPPIPSHFSPVRLHFRVGESSVSNPSQTHKLKLLADTSYNPVTDSITWEKDGKSDGLTRMGNVSWLADCYKRVMDCAKVFSA
ncbi:MAG: hypothetical protein SGCHY_005049 [Lobulomycetales sp.]